MKFISFTSVTVLALLALPLAARADHNPDFDDDAKPILRMQPGLLEYVESRFQVKDDGVAKVPGNDDRHAMPPYIFQAKPRGYPGPYYLTMLIQPGAPGHILKIVDPTKPRGGAPGKTASAAPQPSAPTPAAPPKTVTRAPAPQAPAQPLAPPTADTPSGPITSESQLGSPSLEPPPDMPPAPAAGQ